MSNSYWITNPGGHRRQWRSEVAGQDGTVIDGPFGPTTMIVPPAPEDDDEWVCDFCNGQILTLWGNEPWPVPSHGSYALCNECARSVMDSEGWEVWPLMSCGCAACRATSSVWMARYMERVQ